MKYLLLIPCLVLCSCSSKEEEEPKNPSLPSSGSVETAPSILDCPAEDIAEYPVPDEPIPPPPPPTLDEWCERFITLNLPCPDIEHPPAGWCSTFPKASVEELSFGKEGGVRCVTTSMFPIPRGGEGCRTEFEIVSDTVNMPPTFFGVKKFKKEVCAWLTAMKAGEQVIHISVDKNETGSERKMYMGLDSGNCHGGFTITQSDE